MKEVAIKTSKYISEVKKNNFFNEFSIDNSQTFSEKN